MIPDDLTESKLLEALDKARLVYLDGRLHETALVVAQEVTAFVLSMSFFNIVFIANLMFTLSF